MTAEAFDCSAGAVLDRLKERLEIGTDTDLAVRFGCPRATVSRWRRRNRVPFDVVVRACCQAGIDLDWILTGRFSAWTVGDPKP